MDELMQAADSANNAAKEKVNRGEALTPEDYTNLLNRNNAVFEAFLAGGKFFEAFYADDNLNTLKVSLRTRGFVETFDESTRTYTVTGGAENGTEHTS